MNFSETKKVVNAVKLEAGSSLMRLSVLTSLVAIDPDKQSVEAFKREVLERVRSLRQVEDAFFLDGSWNGFPLDESMLYVRRRSTRGYECLSNWLIRFAGFPLLHDTVITIGFWERQGNRYLSGCTFMADDDQCCKRLLKRLRESRSTGDEIRVTRIREEVEPWISSAEGEEREMLSRSLSLGLVFEIYSGDGALKDTVTVKY